MLDAKLTSYLEDGMPYETLMYVQSYIARKKKKASPNSTLFNEVIIAVKLFLQYNYYEYAGTLVDWAVDSGNLKLDATHSDLNSLLAVIEEIPQDSSESYHFIAKFFLKLRKSVVAYDKNTKSDCLRLLCTACFPIFFLCKQWRQAVECCIVTSDAKKMCEVLDVWAKSGDDKILYPMYFVRTYLYLLTKEKQNLANTFFALAKTFVDNPERTGSGKEATALWHFVSMINDLTMMDSDSAGRLVNKAAIFASLVEFYESPLNTIDSGLLPLIDIIAVKQFKIRPKQAASPFAMLQNMFNA